MSEMHNMGIGLESWTDSAIERKIKAQRGIPPRPSGYYFDESTPVTATWPLPNAGRGWTERDEDLLKRGLQHGHSLNHCAKILGRTTGAVMARIELNNWGFMAKHISFNTENSVAVLPKPKEKFMNFNHLITLLQKGYTTVQVSFNEGKHVDGDQQYIYKISEKLVPAVDDRVVVPVASGGFKVATIRVVDPEPQIDIKAPYALKWVASKVDMGPYNEQIAKEEQAVQMLQQGERKKAQEEAMEALLASVPNRAELLALLGQ